MKLNEALMALNNLAENISFSICPETNDGRIMVYPDDDKAIQFVLDALRWRKWPEERPEARKKVLVNVVLPNGKARRTCAVYFEENQLENDWEDYDGEDEFAPAGWYEEPLEFEGCRVLDGVTHFLPIHGPEAME